MFVTTYDYKYYIEGRYLAILQRAEDLQYDPYLTVVSNLYKTPESSQLSGIMLRYTETVTAPTDEVTDIGVTRDLALGLVHYVKYRMYSDKDLKMATWNYNKFLYYVAKHNSNIKGTPPLRVMPSYGSLR